MKAVLISIQPKWCELIASSKKTVEFRKTKPKLETPFKVYIYETKDKAFENIGVCGYNVDGNCYVFKHGGGKVIDEFVCDCIISHCEMANADIAEQQGCIKREKLFEYANGKELYGWHISDLVIYDKPKELREFKPYNRTEDDCKFSHLGYAIPKCADCHECYVKRPPQSWCYVEELAKKK